MLEREKNGIGYLAGDWPLDPEKSTLVFIHGAGGSSVFWQAQIKGLSSRVNTLAIDLPGRGRSIGDGRQTIAGYAEDVDGFLNKIDIQTPIICGLSMGGAIAQQMLIAYPKRLKAGILIATGARMEVAPAFFETIKKDYEGFTRWMSKICVSKKTDPHKADPFREDLLRCRPEVTINDFGACDRFNVIDHISAINSPVLVVTAEDDKLTPPKYGAELAKGIKNAVRSHIVDAGHIVPVEKPDAVNKEIIQFLDQAGL
jgi:pimeloyl-ACP methyl ester carboxylesterase